MGSSLIVACASSWGVLRPHISQRIESLHSLLERCFEQLDRARKTHWTTTTVGTESKRLIKRVLSIFYEHSRVFGVGCKHHWMCGLVHRPTQNVSLPNGKNVGDDNNTRARDGVRLHINTYASVKCTLDVICSLNNC